MTEAWNSNLTALVAGTALLAAAVPAATASGVAPVNPIVNGEFELSTPRALFDQTRGTPVDECTGVGHQVFYGSETPQARAEDAAEAAEKGSQEGVQENASAAADHADSPEEAQEEALFQAGYGHCVFSEEEGYDLAWINPVSQTRKPAVGWSMHDEQDERTVTFGDFQGDGDREALFVQKPNGSGHNLWQSWLSQNQAFTADFQALEFTVESGTIPDNARIQVSLSATPLNNQSDEVPFFRDCALNFHGDDLASTLDDGRVSMDPVDAGFIDTGDRHCTDLADKWKTADDDERRDILSRLRVVQFSFWRFQNTGPLMIDDVSLTQTATVAEGAVNAQVNPDTESAWT